MITIFHYRHISMIGWWILIVLSMRCYQHLTIAYPSGVYEHCCTYRLMRTQVKCTTVTASVCVAAEWMSVSHTWKRWSASDSPMCWRSSPLVWPTLPAACRRFCRGWRHHNSKARVNIEAVFTHTLTVFFF